MITAGNASQISNGAAVLLVASKDELKRFDLAHMGRILGGTWLAGETWRVLEAPVPAALKLLAKLELTAAVDLFENSEAFAISSVLYHRLLDIPYVKLNIWDGVIALGHPIGCSGARIIVTLLNVLWSPPVDAMALAVEPGNFRRIHLLGFGRRHDELARRGGTCGVGVVVDAVP